MIPNAYQKPRQDFLVFYLCKGNFDMLRAVTETDSINAIIAARREERALTGVNCPDCVLAAVKLAS